MHGDGRGGVASRRAGEAGASVGSGEWRGLLGADEKILTEIYLIHGKNSVYY